MLPICAKLEQDIAELDGQERAMFLGEMGIESPVWTGSFSAPTTCWA